MSDTYAVVNKVPKYTCISLPKANTESSSHHYVNDPTKAQDATIYSTVRPRNRPVALDTHVYNTAIEVNQSQGAGPQAHIEDSHLASADDDYEDFSANVATLPSQDSIGFNCRVQKPRGPRDPPAEWSKLER
ncbi:tyrosine-protein phosphatase non-receptor type 18 [Synchiropus picturatus]